MFCSSSDSLYCLARLGAKEKCEMCVIGGLGWGNMGMRCANKIALKVDLPYLTPETFCSKYNFILQINAVCTYQINQIL